MITIQRHSLSTVKGPQYFYLPIGHEILSVHVHDGWVVFWVKVDTDSYNVERIFNVYETNEILTHWGEEYLGTVQLYEKDWHIFVNKY